MALSTLDRNPESSIVGRDAVRPRLKRYKETGEVETNFKVLPSNSMGGYGQYYGGSLYQLGLTSRNEEGIERCAPGKAVEIAEAFHEIVQESPFCKNKHYAESSFPIKVLEKSARSFSLDALREPIAKRERQLLLNRFFGWDSSDQSQADILRRHTLTLLLHVVQLYNRAGFKPPVGDTDKYLVRPPYYYDVLWPEQRKTLSYDLPPALSACHGFWKQFCVHQYLTQGLEHLLTAVLETVDTKAGGMEAESVSKALSGRDFTSKLRSIFGDSERPEMVLKRLKISAKPSELACRHAQETYGAGNKLSEERILNFADGTSQGNAALAVAILAVLFAKWRNYSDRFSQYIFNNAGQNLCAPPVLNSIDEWLEPSLSWQVALMHLIEPFILQQHDRVMYEKGKLESCWFHWVDGKIVKDQDYSPGFRASRHWNCVMIMTDLGLLNIDDKGGISVTAEGRGVLSRLLKDHDAT
jgi:hypothetical protein